MDKFFKFNERESEFLKQNNDSYEKNLSMFATKVSDATVYSYKGKERVSSNNDLTRNVFMADCDKIINHPLYNRYQDKTQVFSLYKNDDISRRALHVQLVSRISRTIGRALRLNTDLIEAIALGHDMGHTPFGHKGEFYLNEIYHNETGRFFNHNVQSVRVFSLITDARLTVQTLDGILCHNGERAFIKYEPDKKLTSAEFTEKFTECILDQTKIKLLKPSTLEGCVVRISDMIAYIGKDRQDFFKSGLNKGELFKDSEFFGKDGMVKNYLIIRNLTANIIKNSIEKNYIGMDEEVFEELQKLLNENYTFIYGHSEVVKPYEAAVKPMFELIYEKFLNDLKKGNEKSVILSYYLSDKILGNYFKEGLADENDVVCDFIASMTDDYMIDLFKNLVSRKEIKIKSSLYTNIVKNLELKSYFD